MTKIRAIDEALSLIQDGATVAVGGTGPVLEPDLILKHLEGKFLDQGHPRNLTLFSPIQPGFRPDASGLNCFAHEGMLGRFVGSTFTMDRNPPLIRLLLENKCEGYFMGMGPAFQLLTAIGSGKPGVFTTVGIETALDPRHGGGCINERSRNPLVRLERIDGKEYLFYPTLPIHVAIIRGTTADENGYISCEEEPNSLGLADMAMAARASGGKVIAQVKRVARAGSLDPRFVRIPGPLIDALVVHPTQTQVAPPMGDPLAGWNPFLVGALKMPLDGLPKVKPGPARVILRRAALELRPRDVINLGAGIATELPLIALEEGILDQVVFTNEHGIFGGVMASAVGGSFIPAINPDAIMDSTFQFNFYDGGGLDITFLGMGEVDAVGNLNVTKFGGRLGGPGGFNDITDRTPRIVFCGTLTSGGLEVHVESGRLKIQREGRFRKFVPQVEQVTFNARRALDKGQTVLYVTERAVFRLGGKGPVLIEIAPGIEVDRDIRPHMAFPLTLSPELRSMPRRVFADEPLGLREAFPAAPLAELPSGERETPEG